MNLLIYLYDENILLQNILVIISIYNKKILDKKNWKISCYIKCQYIILFKDLIYILIIVKIYIIHHII